MYTQTPPVIYSTGHSLGGGLAQQFAYALPDALLQQGQNLPRVIQVYAFDPSPVTGYYSLEKQIRMQNSKGLRTDRIFERGEILAVVRSFLALVRPPSMMNPAVRAVRYSFEGIRDPIYAHNIGRFAKALYLSGVEKPRSQASERL
jgi:pimeloyl-ACP methyl ester carboxylesterase